MNWKISEQRWVPSSGPWDWIVTERAGNRHQRLTVVIDQFAHPSTILVERHHLVANFFILAILIWGTTWPWSSRHFTTSSFPFCNGKLKNIGTIYGCLQPNPLSEWLNFRSSCLLRLHRSFASRTGLKTFMIPSSPWYVLSAYSIAEESPSETLRSYKRETDTWYNDLLTYRNVAGYNWISWEQSQLAKLATDNRTY